LLPGGVEPPRLAARAPKARTSTNSIRGAIFLVTYKVDIKVRKLKSQINLTEVIKAGLGFKIYLGIFKALPKILFPNLTSSRRQKPSQQKKK
jgi:hypothetical protein